MSYNLRIEKKDDILWVTATGKKRSVDIVLAMSKDILQACVKKKVKSVLLDVSKLEGRIKTIDAYDIPDQHFSKMQDRNIITSLAIVDLKGLDENYRFFENVAVNRGFNLRIFSEFSEAIEWLKK